MRVSVIIPTYCPKKYLMECLESLCNQTLSKQEYEVILVLNGDLSYADTIREFINNNAEVNWNFIQTEVPGVSNARNLGLNEAKGDYIAFIDDDDFVSPQYLDELLRESSEDTVSLCYPLSFIDGTNEYVPFHITDCYDALIGRNRYTINNARSYFSGPVFKLIHKNIIGGRRYDTRLANGEDTLFMFQISDRIKSIHLTSKEAIYYRRFREGSATEKKRTTFDHIKTNSLQIKEILKCYFRNPFQYNFPLFVSRCGAGLYDIFDSVFLKHFKHGIS